MSMTADHEWIKMAIRLEHKGYVGGAEHDTTGHLQGAVEGLADSVIVYDGDSVAELAADFVRSVDEYLTDCEVDGIPAETPKLLSAM